MRLYVSQTQSPRLQALVGSALLLLSLSAHSAVIQHPLTSDYTLDTETNLAWLDLTRTRNLSYLNVLELTADPTSDLFGLRYATTDELGTWLAHAGIHSADTPNANYDAVANLQALVGTTGNTSLFDTDYTYSLGMTGDIIEVVSYDDALQQSQDAYRYAQALVAQQQCIQTVIVQALANDQDISSQAASEQCPLNYTPSAGGDDETDVEYRLAIGSLAVTQSNEGWGQAPNTLRVLPGLQGLDAAVATVGSWLVADSGLVGPDQPTSVPEPSALALLGIGLGMLGWRVKGPRS